MRRNHITAAVIAGLTGIWLLSGLLIADEGHSEQPSLALANAERAERAESAPRTVVRARAIEATALPETLRVRGRTENKRTVEVRAETRGRIVDRPVERGDRVAAGDLLCRIADEERPARITESKEAVNQMRLEYAGAAKLKDRGFHSETAIAQARARLASAQARLREAVLDLERTRIRAPFAGVVEDVALEIGDYAQPGTPCARIVDMDPMLLVGQITERDVHRVAVGASARGHLASDAAAIGRVSFVGRQAQPDTRTYRIEVQVPNPDYALRSGITAQIDIRIGEIEAHRISPAVLALDDDGRIGVRIVDDRERVLFKHVDIVGDEAGGVWVTGLPRRSLLITVGQELVAAGERVAVQLQDAPPADAADDSGVRKPLSPALADGGTDAVRPT